MANVHILADLSINSTLAPLLERTELMSQRDFNEFFQHVYTLNVNVRSITAVNLNKV